MILCPNCQHRNLDTARFCPQCGQSLGPTGSGQRHVQAAATKSLIGRVIDGKYKIQNVLAEGGIGSIYRARRVLIGDEVAVKTLQPDWESDAEMLERFRREAQTAARLKHPNVVTIHDFGRTADGQLYLVMELVEGRNLREFMRGRKQLPAAFVAEILEQVSSALDEAHRHGIVHRDLKPENIVLAEAGASFRVKVLDFGIAHWRDLAAGATTLTQTGAVLGTPRYMSPEQCMGQEVDGRSDVYTLGVMLFEMLTGAPPFNSPTPAAVIAQHLHQKPPQPRLLNPEISRELEQVVLQALSKSPEDRQPSAGEVARQFAEVLQEPMSPRAASPSATNGPSREARPRLRAAEASAPPSTDVIDGVTGRGRMTRGRYNHDGTEPRRTTANIQQAKHKGCARDLVILAMLALALAGSFTWWKFRDEKRPAATESVSAPSTGTSDDALRLARNLTPADALARAESAYKEGRYEEAASYSKAVLTKSPDQPRAEALLGQSNFMLGQDEVLAPLNRALTLGAVVTLPVKHHHLGGILNPNDAFCTGELSLQKGAIEFRSDSERGHSFSIKPQALSELRDESHKGARIHTRIAFGPGGATQNYNFYPSPAGRRVNRSRMSAACDLPLCQRQAVVIYQLLRQVKS